MPRAKAGIAAVKLADNTALMMTVVVVCFMIRSSGQLIPGALSHLGHYSKR